MSTSHVALYKRNNGIWYVLYTIDGKRRWKSTHSRTKSDALSKLSELEKTPPGPVSHKSLKEFEELFLSYAVENYAQSTLGIFQRAFRDLENIVGNPPLDSLSHLHLDTYRTARLKAVSPASVNIELRALRSMMSVAVRWKLLSENPFRGMKQVRVPEKPPTYFSQRDLQILLSTIKEEWFKELVAFAALSGMRRGEILNLRWENVDLPNRLVRVQSDESFRTKTGKNRIIPLNEIAAQLLIQRQRDLSAEYVFSLAGHRISPRYISHKLKRHVRKAGVNPNLHFHSLRHTFATWLVQAGVSIYEVQKLLGHSSVAMTQIYSHLAPTELHSAVNRIALELPAP
jgi:integrase